MRDAAVQRQRITVKRGTLRVRELAFETAAAAAGRQVRVTVGGKAVRASSAVAGRRLTIELGDGVSVGTGESLEVVIG